MEKKKISKMIPSQKCIFVFNIFNESKENDHIANMLTCSDTKPKKLII